MLQELTGCKTGTRLTRETALATNDDENWAAALTTLPDGTLEEVNRLWTIARAFSNTAHAVNNSLQVISGRAELLQDRAGIDPALMPSLRALSVQSGRAASAISDLLTYARGSAGTQVLDLSEIVDIAVAMRAHTLSRARIAIAVERRVGERYLVMASRREMLQLLLNLVLMMEAHMANQSQARIVVRLVLEPAQCRVVVTGSAVLEQTARTIKADEFDLDAQQRVVIRLAKRMLADLAIEYSAQRLPAFTLTVPGADAAG